MFFRREKPKELTFADRVQALAPYRITTDTSSGGGVTARRGACAALVEEKGSQPPHIARLGLQIGQEIGVLIDAGFQKFFTTESGKKLPAQAEHLKALHAFEEDLREGLGLGSLYNESLGTTNANHMYDRVRDRDKDRPRKPWEVRL